MAIAASRWVVVTDRAHSCAVAAWSAVGSPVIALLRVFDSAVAASRRVGIAALVDPGTVRAAVGARGSVEVTIVALFGVFSDAIATAAGHPCAIGAATVSFMAIVGSVVALFSRLDNTVTAFICSTDGGAVG